MRSELTDQEKILQDIIDERVRQKQIYGDPRHAATDWSAILAAEVGEVAEEALTILFNGMKREVVARLRTEAIQVAAVAVAIVEAIDEHLLLDDEVIADDDN